MLDDFREWLSDNLRYILLGLAGILVIVIAVFAIRLITSIGSPKEKETESEISTEVLTESSADSSEEERLVKDQADILSFVSQYYAAVVGGDFDAVASYSKTFDDAARTDLENNNSAIESCNNIITYSRAGLTDGSYVVYVYFDAKMTGIDTEVPTLRQLYLEPGQESGFQVVDISLDENQDIENYTQQLLTDNEVKALREDVGKKYEEAVASDEQLQNYLNPTVSGDGGSDEGDGTPEDTGAITTTGTMYAKTQVNVRGTPSTDGTLYGSLTEGLQVEVLENTESGWSKVRYLVNGTTIEGYVKSEYLTTGQ